MERTEKAPELNRAVSDMLCDIIYSACPRCPQRVLVPADRSHVEVFCISDLHVDSSSNMKWMKEKCISRASPGAFSVLIVPGDIGSGLSALEEAFRFLCSQFDLVCYVPGNHEAWVHKKATTDVGSNEDSSSLGKLRSVLTIAQRCGAAVGPVTVLLHQPHDHDDHPHTRRQQQRQRRRSIRLIPLYSWYHSGFDTEPDLPKPQPVHHHCDHDRDNNNDDGDKPPSFDELWSDFSLCHWPEHLVKHSDFASTAVDDIALAKFFGQLNERSIAWTRKQHRHDGDDGDDDRVGDGDDDYDNCSSSMVMTFSHFLPRLELCPEKRFLLQPQLPKVLGSRVLEQQIRAVRSRLHLFGHSHIPIDLTLEGVRYLQWPLGYVRERQAQCIAIAQHGPLLVYDSRCHDDDDDDDNAAAGVVDGDSHEDGSSIVRNSDRESVAAAAAMAVTGGQTLSRELKWSSYYAEHDRDPSCTTLAPWVVQHYKTMGLL